MAENLSLEKTWELCLEMWKWISEEYAYGGRSVDSLKIKWLRDNGYDPASIKSWCFFCDWTKGKNNDTDCYKCPGKEVEGDFSCCDHRYYYDNTPKKFYNKLLELNKIRKGNKMSKEMTVREISKALGEEVKIVKEKPKPVWKFGDTANFKNGYENLTKRFLLHNNTGHLEWFAKDGMPLGDKDVQEKARIHKYVKTGNIFSEEN